jgi:hypothetical protein
MLAAGTAALLLTTGCAATPGTAQTPAAIAATTTPAAAPASTAPAASEPTGASAAGVPASDKYAERLVVDSYEMKAGGTLHVSGGTMTPGSTVKVYAAQQVVATYNPTTGMYGGPDEVLLTETVSAVVDAQGHYDVPLVIPAGTAHQTLNVEMISPDGNGNLVQVTVF